MKRLILNYHFWLLGILSMIFNSCSTKYKVVSENSGAKKIYNLKYGEDKRNTMDVFLPEKYSSETPIVMLIHGGAWVFGNKSHVRSIQNFLMENNVPVENLDLIILGNNGDSKTDEHYNTVAQHLFGGKRLVGYKNYCGEYPTSSAFALWMATMMIEHGKKINNATSPKKILIYNNIIIESNIQY